MGLHFRFALEEQQTAKNVRVRVKLLQFDPRYLIQILKFSLQLRKSNHKYIWSKLTRYILVANLPCRPAEAVVICSNKYW